MFYWQVSPAGVHLLLGNESFNGYSCPTASRLPAGENSYNKVFAKYWPTCAALFVVQLNLPTILIHCRNIEAVVLQGVWRSFNVCVCVSVFFFSSHISIWCAMNLTSGLQKSVRHKKLSTTSKKVQQRPDTRHERCIWQPSVDSATFYWNDLRGRVAVKKPYKGMGTGRKCWGMLNYTKTGLKISSNRSCGVMNPVGAPFQQVVLGILSELIKLWSI